jgi:hypothetical protein
MLWSAVASEAPPLCAAASSQYHRAVAGGSSTLPTADCQLPIYGMASIVNHQSAIANVTIHPVLQGGTDSIQSGAALRLAPHSKVHRNVRFRASIAAL